MSDGLPPCPHSDGHDWVSGEGEPDDETRQIVIISRYCNRCGYIQDFEEADR